MQLQLMLPHGIFLGSGDGRVVAGFVHPPAGETLRDLALRRAMLPERRTGATLGDVQLRSHLLNAGTVLTGLMLGYTLLAFGTAFEVIKGAPKLVVERCELVSKVV
jgi:hypothetical protein